MKCNISFCLYGTNKKYFIGAEKNIEINKKLLPDWNTIIYYDSNEIDVRVVNNLISLGAELRDVNQLSIKKNVDYQMFWRYFVFEESSVSIIRDLDSRLSNREVKYINNWMESEKNYFIIRDHPWHSQVPGGLFGIKNPKNFWDFFVKYVQNNNLGWGKDQEMLHEYMSGYNENNIAYFGYDNKNYIKRDDENFFIGIQLDENDNPISPIALQYLKDIGF